MLFREWRADIELRGVGASCRVMLFRELVRAEESVSRSSDPFFYFTVHYRAWSKNGVSHEICVHVCEKYESCEIISDM